MKLKECLTIGRDCGLEDVGDAYWNVKHHATNIFTYNEIHKELKELVDEINSVSSEGLIDANTSIDDCLKILSDKE